MPENFETLKKVICENIMAKESPAQIIKTCLDAFCLITKLHPQVDVNEVYEKWQKGEEV